LERPEPEYPPIARQRRWTGTVKLRILIRADGSVGNVDVIESSGHEVLDEAALEMVRERWRFLPARQGGKPVDSERTANIRFTLKDQEEG
jgi:protein TonB